MDYTSPMSPFNPASPMHPLHPLNPASPLWIGRQMGDSTAEVAARPEPAFERPPVSVPAVTLLVGLVLLAVVLYLYLTKEA